MKIIIIILLILFVLSVGISTIIGKYWLSRYTILSHIITFSILFGAFYIALGILLIFTNLIAYIL